MRNLIILIVFALIIISCSERVNQNTLEYDFTITEDIIKHDILLVGPKDEYVYIGNLGRDFYPTDETKANKNEWPIGKWIIKGACPPDDPPHASWDYELTLREDGTVGFTETEYSYKYDKNLQLTGTTTRISLLLNGRWEMYNKNKGIIRFNKK